LLADFREAKHIEMLSKEIHRMTDHLDILLSNAGTRRDPSHPIQNYSTASVAEIQESLLSHSAEGWRDTFSINTSAHFFLTAQLLDLLAASAKKGDGRGCVVVTSSCASMHLCTNVDLMSYAASKAATDHLVGMLAAKLGRFGIRVNGINPGCLLSSLWRADESF
jgi:NAD(P)-dependent dehydrogenase (short-subunit alcohol dehydrogenase family)